MLSRTTIMISFVVLSTFSFSQTQITWETLEDVRFSEKYSVDEASYYYYPHFGPIVKGLEGEEVYLRGYMLALDPDAGYYLLSRYPMASCFFCGTGGPESIVELKLAPGQKRFRMDQIVTIKGKLKLNSEDIYQCNYIFEQAEKFRP